MQKDYLKHLIETGQYQDAYLEAISIPVSDILNIAISAMDENADLTYYAFMEYMYNGTSNIKYLNTLISLTMIEYCYLEGGYQLGLFNYRKIIEKYESVETLTGFLASYYSLPDVDLYVEELENIINKVISYNPKDRDIRILLNKVENTFSNRERTIGNVTFDSEGIYKCLYNGNFLKLQEICQGIDKEQIKKELYQIASEDNNIAIWGFSQYMSEKTKDPFWLDLTLDILENALDVKGAKVLASYFKAERREFQ